MIRFTVPGRPVGKGRPRASARIVTVAGQPKAIVTMHTPPETVRAERAMLQAFRRATGPGHAPLVGPVKVTVEAIFAVPPSWPAKARAAAATGKLWHVSKPDADNVGKLALDALNGHAWHDDSQVAISTCAKRYGHPERIEVRIEPLPQGDLAPTPAQRAMEKRVAAGPDLTQARMPTRKERGKRPAKLEAAIAAALARDARR